MSEPREMDSRDTRWNDQARFLEELRDLRDHAGLGHAELAARAHYPCDVISAAEAGPSLPDLPVLSAYVRACGGTFGEWEDRWRALTGCPASPLLPARTAGCSEAATAGARIGATSAAADAHDPALVMAALSRVADEMAASPAAPSQSSASASWFTPAPQDLPDWPSGAAGSLVADAAVPDTMAAVWVPDPVAPAPRQDYWAPGGVGWDPATAMPAGAAAAAAAEAFRAQPAADVPPAQAAVPTSVPVPAPAGYAGRVTAAGSRRAGPSRMALAAIIAAVLLLVVAVAALVF